MEATGEIDGDECGTHGKDEDKIEQKEISNKNEMRKIIAKVFYRIFLKETTPEMYVSYSDGTRKPTEIGELFYKVYLYLLHYEQ